MKALTLTSTLIAILSLSAFGETNSALRSQLSSKQKELAQLQKEISSLQSRISQPSSAKGYVVKTGDTASSIARRHKISLTRLAELNNLSDPSKISVGQTLSVGASAKPKAAPAQSKRKSGNYTVQKGDTLYAIARRHRMSVAQLLVLNPGVKAESIASGQKIQVAGTPRKAIASTKKKAAKSRTASLRSSKSSTVSTRKKKASAPKPKKKASKTVSTKKKSSTAVTRAAAPKPAPKKKIEAPAPPKIEEAPAPKTPSSVASIILTDETTFKDFASKHGTSTSQLNALNGWNLPQATVLARGSEIYVPK